MGLTHVIVKVRSLKSEDSFTANFLVDTGAWNSYAPANELKRIGIEPRGNHEFELANGQREEYEWGYAELEFMDEVVAARIIFGPPNTEPLLGVAALENAGFVVDPKNETLRQLLVFPLKILTSAKIAVAR